MIAVAVTAAEVQRHLEDIDYPCQKEDVVRHAEAKGAPEQVVAALRALPLGEYASPADLTKGLPA